MDVLPGRVYTHHKGGAYRVIAVAVDSTNARAGVPVVVYAPLSGEGTYCRDQAEFIEEVSWPDGSTRPRFVLAE